jgi:signal peptidase I
MKYEEMQEILLNEGIKAIKSNNKGRLDHIIKSISTIERCYVYRWGENIYLPIVYDPNSYWIEIKKVLHIEE